MKKQETQTIKTTYSDALYWSMSPMSRDKKYHLTRLNESILRKLIHYDKKKKKITYSNEWISKHVFLDITQIEKSIPHLEKKGFINCITFSTRNKEGKMIKRRIINIDWDFIEEVLSEVPELKFIKKETDVAEQKTNEGDEKIKVSQEDNQKKDQVENGVETTSANEDFDVHEYLTKRKLDFIKKLDIDDSEIERFYTIDKTKLDEFFYGSENIWEIKTLEKDKEDHWENIHGVNLFCSGFGNVLKLFILNNNDEFTDSFQLSWSDFQRYLEKMKISFGDVTRDNYEILKQYKKQQLI